jgi:hypothetical protein
MRVIGKPSQLKTYGRYGTVGLEVFLSLVLGFLGGQWLDRKLAGGHGWLTALGVVAGLYAGVRSLVKAAKMMQRESEEEDARRDPNAPPLPNLWGESDWKENDWAAPPESPKNPADGPATDDGKKS